MLFDLTGRDFRYILKIYIFLEITKGKNLWEFNVDQL